MSFPSLFSICFDYIKEHTQGIVSLEGVPFNPIVENLIQHLFTSDTPLNSSILSVIAESHSKELRKAELAWSSLLLSKAANRSAVPALTAISKHFPKFITCLKLGQSNISNQDIFLLRGFTNLKTLHLGKNPKITDRGVLYLTSIISAAPSIGLPYLEDLHLCDLPGITDKSLKFIGKIPTLVYIDISNTNITELVALRYLSKIGYKRITERITPFEIKSAFDIFANTKFYRFIKDLAYQYDQGQITRPLTAENLSNSSQPALHFSRTLTKYAGVVEEKKPPARLGPAAKKQKLTTNDYLAMFEQEIADDD
ncbi:uncharacterized protein ATC70_011991 [Mucor velutinosus]|uniref:Uncharacterized protein n=1 Tax=Mucor velutinosus TaxID=708070 RepID=A0AAN7I4R8_9FUNG|nr:hypothetical protein ATC70_011991 [Mucor velutinosus]